LAAHEGTSFLLDQGQYDLSAKPTGACLRCNHWVSDTLLDAPAGGNPMLSTSQKQTSLCCSPCLSLPIFLRDFSCQCVKPAAPCHLWPHSNSSSGGAHASSLWAETKSGIYSGMPHAMLGESWLAMAPDDCFSFPLSNAPSDWDSDLRGKVLCCWKCSSTTQWKWPRSTHDC
jgi:hypothetical protein